MSAVPTSDEYDRVAHTLCGAIVCESCGRDLRYRTDHPACSMAQFADAAKALRNAAWHVDAATLRAWCPECDDRC
ncbi:MAG: hypothetical protein QM811_07560 [Pirellulales bacterium]